MMIRRFLSQASLAGVALSCGMGMVPASAIAQSATQVPLSQADLARSSAATALTTNLSLLVKNPHDIAALIGAGEASLELADGNAALGFFGRADDLSPNNGRVKAGLGRAMLQLERNADALRLMEQATVLGYSDRHLLCDRGLARDMTGDQAGAQRDYQAAMKLKPNDTETVRRYAISLGISGQLVPAVTMLQPLLSNSDRAAWRDRAFILAMNGKTDEALGITNQTSATGSNNPPPSASHGRSCHHSSPRRSSPIWSGCTCWASCRRPKRCIWANSRPDWSMSRLRRCARPSRWLPLPLRHAQPECKSRSR